MNNTEIKKEGQQILFGVKIRIDQTELYKTQVIVSFIICKMELIELVREELMHVSEDTPVPPDWVTEWK